MTDIERPDLKEIRRVRGWSQQQLASFLGCDQGTVSRIENGGIISGPILRVLSHIDVMAPVENEAAA
jgi:transcriptional regulator with XRE-family HTH domain